MCPVPTGPALAPATTGSCFWLRQGVLSATLSLTVGFTGKDPPVDTSMMLGDTQQVWVGGTCKTTQPQILGLRNDTSAPDAEYLLLSMRCSGCSATLPLWQFAGMPIPCLVLGFFPLSGRSCLWGWRGSDVPPVLPDASHPYSIPILSHSPPHLSPAQPSPTLLLSSSPSLSHPSSIHSQPIPSPLSPASRVETARVETASPCRQTRSHHPTTPPPLMAPVHPPAPSLPGPHPTPSSCWGLELPGVCQAL